MADDLRAFDRTFQENKWPSAPCPTCKVGDLHPWKDAKGQPQITTVKTGSSARNYDHPDWEPEWHFGGFHGVLLCARSQCGERVVVAGDWTTDIDDEGRHYTAYYRLRFALPAIPLMDPPSGTPEAVVQRIEEASRVVWADPASAANGLRRAVEAVLDHQKINKTAPQKGGGRRRLSTGARITEFKKKHAVAGEPLEAVKWVGNQGSHGDEMTASMVIESAEYLDLALRKLYDKREAEMLKRVAAVNKRKGLRSK